MPIYEYECTECGHRMEVLQKLSETPLTDCPECERSALRKLLSAPQFRLAGGGWYETDFKSEKERRRNLAGDGDKSSDKSSDKKEGKGGASDKADSAGRKTEAGTGKKDTGGAGAGSKKPDPATKGSRKTGAQD